MAKKWQSVCANKSRWFVKTLLKQWFRIKVEGKYCSAKKSIIVANRTSVLDVLLLSIFLPEPLTVALPAQLHKKLWVRCLMLFAEVIPVDPSSASAVRVLLRAVRNGKRCLIFPQGLRQPLDGSPKIYDGPGLIVKKSGAPVIPVRIEGAEKSVFSVFKEKNVIRLFPKIRLVISPPTMLSSLNHSDVSRKTVARELFDMVSQMSYENRSDKQTLFEALLDGVTIATKNFARLEDVNRTPLSYKQFLARVFILGRQLKKQTQSGEAVGVMMPTTIAGMATFFALQAYRRVPAMLNFSAGFYNVFSACKTASISQIYTAKQFVHTAKLEPLMQSLEESGIRIHYLEDFKKSIGLAQKISGLLKSVFPYFAWRLLGAKPDGRESAVVLFTSGSEGVPKGVVLSHRNLLSNASQLLSRVDFSPRDRFFNALPIFHSFGLTAGSILPMITGNQCFFYPSPLHYKIIPGLVYEYGATIMFATDTFLTGYARASTAREFSSVRYIFAGAEKVKIATIQHWATHFGTRIYEGYGATEASPVIALNCPLQSRTGSVGLPLPFLQCDIVPVDGIVEGGRLLVKGPNVMLGYLKSDKPGIIQPLEDGWHDTGDIVSIDAQGYITIVGRAKRFAKLGGEMVSLTSVETLATQIWPDVLHAAITIRSDKKGEQIVLYTEAKAADKKSFIQHARQHGHSELLVPQVITAGFTVPILTSGKIDYVRLQQMDAEQREKQDADVVIAD